MSLVLYSTWGCHLCEAAEQLLIAQQADYRLIDIVDDEAAFALYRTEIPVLQAGKRLLKWPFDAATLAEFLAQPAIKTAATIEHTPQ